MGVGLIVVSRSPPTSPSCGAPIVWSVWSAVVSTLLLAESVPTSRSRIVVWVVAALKSRECYAFIVVVVWRDVLFIWNFVVNSETFGLFRFDS